MKRDLEKNRRRRISNSQLEPLEITQSRRSLSSSLIVDPTPKGPTSVSSLVYLPKPDHANLAETFSSPNLIQELHYDPTVFKILPSLKKKHMPGFYLSLKHTSDLLNKLNPNAKKRKVPISPPKIIQNAGNVPAITYSNPTFSEKPKKSSETQLEIEELKRTKLIANAIKQPLNFYDPIIDPISPKSMVALKRISNSPIRGYSKWFNQDRQFEWKECIVEDYDEKTEKFIIVWPEGTLKYVSRLNLRFEDEDPQKFEKRIIEAKKYREEVESEYFYSLYINSNVSEQQNISINVLKQIFLFLQSNKKVDLSQYRNMIIYSKFSSNVIHNPSRFTWKNEISHFEDENIICKIKGLDNHQDLEDAFLNEIPLFSLLVFPTKKRQIISRVRVKKLMQEYKDHWVFVCKHINYKLEKLKQNRHTLALPEIVNNPTIRSQVKLFHTISKGPKTFIKILSRISEKFVLSDINKMNIAQRLTRILQSWDNLSLLPEPFFSLGYFKDFKDILEIKTSEIFREVENTVFDIQYEIQEYVTKEDQKRIMKNQMKLNARAYRKQVIELEESLSYEFLQQYFNFTFICNIRIENSLRNSILGSLKALNRIIHAPIAELFEKLEQDLELTYQDIFEASTETKGFLIADIGIDLQNKTIFINSVYKQVSELVVSLFYKAINKIECIQCLAINQIGSVRNPPFLSIVSIKKEKFLKIFEELQKNLELNYKLLSRFLSILKEYAFILDINPTEWGKKYESEMEIDKIENEIYRLNRILIEMSDVFGKNGRSVGIWIINSEAVKTVMKDIIEKTINQLMSLLQEDCIQKVKSICKIYLDVKTTISYIPNNLEQLEEIREFIFNEFPSELELLSLLIEKLMYNIDILEGYLRLMPYDVYQRAWTCLGYPTDLISLKTKCLKTLEELILSFTAHLNDQKSHLYMSIKAIEDKLNILKNEDNYLKQEHYALEFEMMQADLAEAEELIGIVRRRETIIGCSPTDFTFFSELQHRFTPYYKLWFYIRYFADRHPGWMSNPIVYLHREQIGTEITNCSNELSKLERSSFKDEKAPLKLIKDFLVELNEFKPYLPIIRCINNPGMKDRHWNEFHQKTGIDLSRCQSMSLRSIIEQGVLGQIDTLEVVSDLATKELALETAKKKMEHEWASIKFELLPYKSCFLLINTDIIWDVLNEHLMRTIAMSSSPYIQFILQEVTSWKENLIKIQEILEEWEKFQKNWQYLQPIFTNIDISKQLSQVTYKFRSVNSQWESIMHNVYNNPNAYDFCINNYKLYDTLVFGNETLDSILKSLNEYLMSKRRAFPRFYFLSNDELVLILSNSQDINAIQKYLSKCFEAIASILVRNKHIECMISPEGEQVRFENMIEVYNGSELQVIEVWMLELEKEMKNTLEVQLLNVLNEKDKLEIKDLVEKWPSQLVHASLMIQWTYNVEKAILSGSMKQLYKSEENFLDSLVKIVRQDLSDLARLTFSTLVVLDVHNKDVIEKLVASNITSLDDFSWFCSLRYYLSSGTVMVRMLDCVRAYGYEYVGNTGRLVLTELTDRCYRTMLSALNMSLGGAPEGPAGTGKTETIKDLAKNLAKKCVVFNCSDRLEHVYMARFFTGLCYCGAWACFDEFNRIELDVLSVIADQILSIQTAVQKQAKYFYLDEDYVQIDPTCAIFITMNPDYTGRTQLPDNLKALFRPVAMMIPDYAMIAEIYLYSYGFFHARTLSQKITNSLKLASEQLSTQNHYDYGMRSVSTIIRAAGWLKQQRPKENEEILILMAIKTSNIPKFLNQDLPLFKGIVLDLFPGVETKEELNQEVRYLLETATEELKLEKNDNFLTKAEQFYSSIQLRHGVMIVGETLSGKSTTISTLAKALGYKLPVQAFHINPKSMSLSQLYGAPDPISLDWKDGILSNAIRLFSESNSKSYKWIIMDGPVDAIWIENMNTVLDDNKRLCLPSGEIIKLNDLTRIIMEVDDLSFASPATISRCGMIYIGLDILGPSTHLANWINFPPANFNEKHFKQFFTGLFNDIFCPVLDYWDIHIRSKQIIQLSICQVTKNFINLFQSFLISKGKSRVEHDSQTVDYKGSAKIEIKEMSVQSNQEEEIGLIAENNDEEQLASAKTEKREVEKITFFCITATLWALGAICNCEERKNLSDYIYSIGRAIIDLPEDFFNMYFNEESHQWIHFSNNLEIFQQSSTVSRILVPTISLVSYRYIINELLPRKSNLLVTGNTGTGKTLMMKTIIEEIDTNFKSAFTLFSARSTAADAQRFIEGNLSKRRKGCIGPDVGKFFIFVIDDLNMPTREKNGAKPAIELIRTVAERAELYDYSTLEHKILENVQYAGVMAHSGVSSASITTRILSHFFLINFSNYDTNSLFIILNTLLKLGLSSHCSDIVNCSEKVANGTIRVYEALVSCLPPTPMKSHYTFNLRDLSNILKGILLVKPNKLIEPSILYRLWVHECLRVFSDRLIDDTEKELVLSFLKDSLIADFNTEWSSLITFEPVFCNLTGDHSYQEIINKKVLGECLLNSVKDFNADHPNAKLNLIFFDYAIQHINRIARVLSWSRGNLLLVGMGSNGRKSLTKLCAYILQIKIRQLKITKNYSLSDWAEDLKDIFMITGIENKKLILFLRENDIIDENFLEGINNILNTGYVPGLLSDDEISGINESLKMNKKYLLMSNSERWEIFLQNVTSNLHIIISLFSQGEKLRARIRQFPALVNCCTIDWFSEWPYEALQTVAKIFLEAEAISESFEEINSGVEICLDFHKIVFELSKKYFEEFKRHNYVTPSNFLQFLNAIKRLFKVKMESITKQSNKYSIGVQKLDLTQNYVQKLRSELLALKPILEQKTASANETLKEIQKENADADITRNIVALEQKSSAEQAELAEQIKHECEYALAKAIPELEAAIKALDTIRRDDIDLVKTMHNPPEAVRLTLEALAIVNKLKPVRMKDPNNSNNIVYDYYEAGKKMLSLPKFIRDLKSFDRETIEEETVNKITPYMSLQKFHPDIVKYASSAAEGLCKWVRAMYNFYFVNKEVKPKKASLLIAEADLHEKMRLLKIKQDELNKVEEYINSLQEKLNLQITETKALSSAIKKVELQMDRAVKLIDQLGGERQSWALKIEQYKSYMKSVLGDMIMSAGVVCYLGPFISSYRDNCIAQWKVSIGRSKVIRCSPDFSLSTSFGDPVTIQKWALYGLPSDKVSIENALIMKISSGYPLLIDPQGQASKWLKKMLVQTEKQFIHSKINSLKFLSTLENAMFLGADFIIEDVSEQIDVTLDPLLRKQFIYQNGSYTVPIADVPKAFDPNFYVYLFTNMTNPHYSPEVSSKVTILNFTITEEGLCEQLLDLICRKELPRDTDEKNRLTVQTVEYSKTIQNLEDKILELLKSGDGNILENEELINSLTESKELSSELEKKLANTKNAEQRIIGFQANYKPAARHSSVLYFCIADLANIDPMYQYSMNWFINIFKKALSEAEKSKDINERVKNITLKFRELTYLGMYNSLHNSDRTLFVLLIAIRLKFHDKEMQTWQWRFFLTGICGVAETKPNPTSFISDKLWREILQLELHIEGLADHIADNIEVWERFITNDKRWLQLPSFEDFSQQLPEPYCFTTHVTRLLLFRATKPEALGVAIQSFIKTTLGEFYLLPNTLSLEKAFSETTCLKPLIFVLTPGSDPLSMIKRYVNEKGVTLKIVSLGRGQGEKAEKIIREAIATGFWIYVQNCHLALSWLSQLEAIMEQLSSEIKAGVEVNKNFRLILTTVPAEGFPSLLLQKSIKIVAQQPGGLRNSLLSIYSGVTSSKIETSFYESATKPEQWTKLFFCLSFFHCIIRERRMFGSIGWNVIYEFNESDLRISSRQLMEMINQFDTPPFEALIYLTAYCNYGGRVTDEWDRRTLLEILKSFYRENIFEEFSDNLVVVPGYNLSNTGSIEFIISSINAFPQVQSPEIFGLHPNADISKAIRESYQLCSRLLELQPRAVSTSFAEQKSSILLLSDQILGKISHTFDIPGISEKYPIDYLDSLSIVLVQELNKYNNLIKMIHQSLQVLKQCYEGVILITSDYEVLAESLLNNTVPGMWENVSYSTCKSLAAYVDDLVTRISFFNKWAIEGRPSVFWMPGFFFTQSFLTAVLQEYSRQQRIPIDTISFAFEVLNYEPQDQPDYGVYVNGLFLEGASWDGQALAECKPRELFSVFPVIWFKPHTSIANRDGNIYICPLYRTILRNGYLSTTGHSTNFILEVLLRTNRDQSHWVKRGTALFTQLDY